MQRLDPLYTPLTGFNLIEASERGVERIETLHGAVSSNS
jgi:hypothetical protein